VALAQTHVRAEEVLDGGLTRKQVLEWDQRHGNADLIRTAAALDAAGPYTVASPWELTDEQGTRRINATGYSALPFGDFHPEMVGFLRAYLERNRSMGLPQETASPWRAAFARNLVALLAEFAPSHADSAVIFSSGGAEAVEVAIKLVRAGRPGARVVITFSGAYHGQSGVALSLTPNPDYQTPFRPLVPDVVTVPYGDLQALEGAMAERGPAAVAGVILEPIQGEAGVIVPPAGYLRAVGELCRRHGILVVADEIQTGLGRTGHWFESLAQGLEPDVITLAKPLGGGLLAVSATIGRKALFERAFGGLGCARAVTTFGGNSLAMAVGLKSLEMLLEGDLPARAARLGERGLVRLQALQARRPGLLEAVRGAGLLFALQFRPVVRGAWLRGAAAPVGLVSGVLGLQALHQAGVEANLSANAHGTVRLTPPLNIPEPLFDEMWARIERMADDKRHAWQMVVHSHPHTLTELVGVVRATRAPTTAVTHVPSRPA
jgi:putrescine aminotransferase